MCARDVLERFFSNYANFSFNEEHFNLVEYRSGVDSQLKTTVKNAIQLQICEANYISSESREEFRKPIKSLVHSISI